MYGGPSIRSCQVPCQDIVLDLGFDHLRLGVEHFLCFEEVLRFFFFVMYELMCLRWTVN